MAVTSTENVNRVLDLRLMGTFEVRVGGQPLPPLRSRKEQWLLALLTLRHDRDVSRDWLAATFWPDNEESQGLFYLRKALSNLRKALGQEAYRIQSPTTLTVRLDLSGAFADVLVFDAAVALEQPEARLVEALSLYRGPLLQDCLEEWVIPLRESRVQSYLFALETVARYALARGEAAAATRWLRLAMAVEPYRESAAGSLMQALAQSGDRAAARQVYQELRVRLREHLNTTPTPETDALYKRLSEAAVVTVPPRTPESSPSAPSPSLRHLPVPLTDLIGRESAIAEVGVGLQRSRLMTLLGPGGIGKTRLAIAAADAVLTRFAEGVWFVDLAPLTDGTYVADAIARRLSVQQEAGKSAEDCLIDALAARSLLLVLDNCEHLLQACAFLSDHLLRSCPGLRILATSRQVLGVTGEQVYDVPSLAVPPPEETSAIPGTVSNLRTEKDPSYLREYDSVELFVQRAMQHNPDFRLGRHNALAVCRICTQLDGIPLAIELAAARVRSLSAGEIAERLTERFRLLTRGSPSALPRQQTLRALIDWSYDLLTESEKVVLCRFSVFAGGWTLESAEEVCAGNGIDAWEILDLVSALCDKSLVVAALSETATRYRLLETIRQYSHDRLGESGETSTWRDQHLACFLALGQQAKPALLGADQVAWLARLETEQENFGAALDWGAETESVSGAASGLQLASALRGFWYLRSYFTEGRQRLQRALDHEASLRQNRQNGEALETGAARADALNNLGILSALQGDYDSAQAHYRESLALYRTLNDRLGSGGPLANLGILAYQQGDYAAARTLNEENLALMRELNKPQNIASSLNNLAMITAAQGDSAEARRLYEECLGILRELGDTGSTATVLNNLGGIAYRQGDYSAARPLYEESLEIMRAVGNRQGIANALINLGSVASSQSDFAAARSFFAESLLAYREIEDGPGIAFGLEGMAGAVVATAPRLAAQLWAAMETLRQELGAPHRPDDLLLYQERVARARAADADAEAFDAAWARGAAMTREQAIEMALSIKHLGGV